MASSACSLIPSLLIANRGEIACRVIRTARRLGVRTIAVYSDADVNAMHVRMADEAYRIGPASARESYLNVAAILEVAKRSGARAIHPGYGFLSENADFAAACAAAGIVFVGPPPEAIRAMGSKIGAKQLMERAGVPIVPGYHGDAQDDATLTAAANRIGYPVLIKASAGGGGKGMRIVQAASELEAALSGARREALKAFSDDRVLIERYLREPRHIEIQVFADSQGNCIHLNERDCSIQRRHQKIIEEAPGPGVSAERRAEMGEAAARAARSVGYVGAGTVEFIAGDGEFYFMEMNTRLQVEHPVTEMTTGIDLVEWQLRIASGEKLPRTQNDVAPRGHAIEARLYAEDPDRGFLPSTGVLEHLRWPQTSANVRIDTGVSQGDAITVHYDPMIAKLIVWGEDRQSATNGLRQALAQCEIAGPTTNLALLLAVTSHAEFAAGHVHTGFIAQHEADLFPGARDVAQDRLAALAVMGWLARHTQHESAWRRSDGWQVNQSAAVELHWLAGERRLDAVASPATDGWKIALASGPVDLESKEARTRHTFQVSGEFHESGRLDARLDGEKLIAGWTEGRDGISVFSEGRQLRLRWDDHLRQSQDERRGGGLRSPMPGQVLQVMVSAGTVVKRGQALMIVEAMKMEHTIVAPADGSVEVVNFAVGDRVAEGAQLLKLSSGAD